ncbi:MAG: hypothetical protein AAF575_14290, partial [Bacteroidota bacterium]
LSLSLQERDTNIRERARVLAHLDFFNRVITEVLRIGSKIHGNGEGSVSRLTVGGYGSTDLGFGFTILRQGFGPWTCKWE